MSKVVYCSIDGCTGIHEGKGYCKRHYQRFHKYGDPLFTKFSKDRADNKGTIKKINKHEHHKNSLPIDFKIDGECFICTSHVYKNRRYAQMRMNGKNKAVHRHVYEQMFGEIPEGMVIMHTCDVPSCINPEHLKLGTQRDNILDCVSKGRHRNAATKQRERRY